MQDALYRTPRTIELKILAYNLLTALARLLPPPLHTTVDGRPGACAVGFSCDISSVAALSDAFGRASHSLASPQPHHTPQRLRPRLPLTVRGHTRHKGLRGRVVRVESSHTPQCVSLCLGLPVPPAQLGSPGCRMLTVSYTIAGCCVIYDIDRLCGLLPSPKRPNPDRWRRLIAR